MKEGDILIAKDNEFFKNFGISKYNKVAITHKYNESNLVIVTWKENFSYKINARMILTESEIAFHFWTLEEHRKFIIENLL